MPDDLQTLRLFFDAINRNDMSAMASLLACEVTRVEPEGFDTAGTYEGIDAVSACVRRGRATWAEGRCEPEDFLFHEGKVVVYLHARVRLASSNEWIDGRFADGFRLKDGKIHEYRTFWDRDAALAWAGISPPPPSPSLSTTPG